MKCVYIYIYIHICMYVCIYIYIYIIAPLHDARAPDAPEMKPLYLLNHAPLNRSYIRIQTTHSSFLIRRQRGHLGCCFTACRF